MTDDISDVDVVVKEKTESTKAVKALPKMTSDIYFKKCMCNIPLARDFLNFNLPEKIKNGIRLETLAMAPQEYLSIALRKKIADVVYTVKLNDADDELGYLIVHIEQQSVPKQLMPLRMIEFMMTISRQFAELQGSGDKLPLPVVIPIILSNHHKPYPYSTKFLDQYTEAGKTLMSTLLNESLPIIDLASLSDEELKKHLRAGLMELALKRVKDSKLSNLLMSSVEIIQSLIGMGEINTDQAGRMLEDLVYYLSDNVKIIPEFDEIEALLVMAQDKLPPETGETMMTLREYFENQGMQQGVQQGMQQGVQQERLDIVRNMILKGLTDPEICEYTGMSAAELAQLKAQLTA